MKLYMIEYLYDGEWRVLGYASTKREADRLAKHMSRFYTLRLLKAVDGIWVNAF